jgi:DNA-binding CsgD family transcriptional regulator
MYHASGHDRDSVTGIHPAPRRLLGNVFEGAPEQGALFDYAGGEATTDLAVRKRVARSVTVDEAMRAWFAGDYERCLHLCDGVRFGDPETRCHVGLLRARALLRLERPGDALAALSDVASLASGTDEALTHRMLTGEAQVRSGELELGLSLLRSAQRDAGSAHPTIRSEIALNIGLAHYARHEMVAAERALKLVDKDADLVYARAIQTRAWIAFSRGSHERAAKLFAHALSTLDNCRHYDRFFEANCVRAIAHLSLERFDTRLWAIVDKRRAGIDWSWNGLSHPRFHLAYCAAAYRLDVEGSPLEAAREARQAERIAPSDPLRVQSICKRASIARHTGEVHGHVDHLEAACETLADLDVASFSGDEVVVPLVIAEELASADSAEARAVFDRYCGLAAISPMRQLAHTSATETYRQFVEAMIYECCGDHREAVQRYRKVLRKFRDTGFTRRAVMAALRLVNLNGDRGALAYADAATKHLSPRSWMRLQIEARKAPQVRLTVLQRELLMQICEGKSNPEIARARGRSLHTVRNMVARLFEIFEVRSREQLAVECVRRGLYPAS